MVSYYYVVVDRREFLLASLAAAPDSPVEVPVRVVIDRDAKWWPGQLKDFSDRIWPECARDFLRGGVALKTSRGEGRVERPNGREPVISGLDPAALNAVITERIPEEWDRGRAVAGVTTLYRDYHLCLIALRRAHGNRIPFVAVNTCTHELLHAVLGDIFESKPKGMTGEWRESRIDAIATKLWWWGGGGAIRESARVYVERLKASYYPRT